MTDSLVYIPVTKKSPQKSSINPKRPMLIDSQVFCENAMDEDAIDFELRTLEDSISWATKQAALLATDQEKLETRLRDLDFNMHELQAELEQLKSSGEPPLPEGYSPFFTYLNSLENKEVEGKARVEGLKQLESELSHQLNRLRQQYKTLSAQFAQMTDQFTADSNSILASQNILTDLNARSSEQDSANEFLVTKADELKSELIQRTEQLKGSDANRRESLQAMYTKVQDQWAAIRTEAKHWKGRLAAVERSTQSAIDAKIAELERLRGVASWMTDRSVQLARLKKLRTALRSERRTQELAEKRDKDLMELLKAASGANDGDSPRARRIVAAEIDRHRQSAQTAAVQSDIESELDYGRELATRLAIASESLAQFEAFREETLTLLGEELAGCEKAGYLEMLREEMNALRRESAKVNAPSS
jgi:hypothetical protein